jgi:Arc/MetJ-type ribon-helix-helix transcriptional regulator
MKTDMLNVRLSKEMVAWLDSLVDNGVYKSRGESIRDFVRDYLEGGGWSGD